MKISSLKASNFRNLKRIDIKFWDINILTWKNSSWKTNLISLIKHCLNTDYDVEKYFGKNIVTYWKGINQSSIKVILSIDKRWFIYWHQVGNTAEYRRPLSYEYNRLISKHPLYVRSQDLYITGQFYSNDSLALLTYKQLMKALDDWGIERKKVFSIESSRESDLDDNITKGELLNIYWVSKDSNMRDFDSFKKHAERSTTSPDVYKFVLDTNTMQESLQAIQELKKREPKRSSSPFSTAKFIFLLADLQKDIAARNNFYDDLSFYTDWILRKVYINTKGEDWSKGDIYVETPHGPRDISYISKWTALILYFVLIKNWLNSRRQSYYAPDIMVFDELDSAIHPSLISKFVELLNIISDKIQLFISTHSTPFIDKFDKKDVYLLKDHGSFPAGVKVKSNIVSYEDIVNSLSKTDAEIIGDMSNSELYIDWYVDSLFPIIS